MSSCEVVLFESLIFKSEPKPFNTIDAEFLKSNNHNYPNSREKILILMCAGILLCLPV